YSSGVLANDCDIFFCPAGRLCLTFVIICDIIEHDRLGVLNNLRQKVFHQSQFVTNLNQENELVEFDGNHLQGFQTLTQKTFGVGYIKKIINFID
ncbi:MAG: hypothetical protein K8F24_13040, partial [Bacteroidales bacterium]|nr:hypothetical protein [Bacteroidales bacterium]